MKLPYIKNLSSGISDIRKLSGLDRRDNAKQGSASELMNMLVDNNSLTPMFKSSKIKSMQYNSVNCAITVNGNIAAVSGGYFWYNDVKAGEIISSSPSICELNGIILIVPDMSYYRISDGTFSSLKFSEQFLSEVKYGRIFSSDYNGWSFGGGLFDYVEIQGLFNFENIFNPGDSVYITLDTPLISGKYSTYITNLEIRVEWAKANRIYFPVNTFMLDTKSYSGDENELQGGIQIVDTISSGMLLKKKTVALDYICEKDNRIWGCKNNTIYASRLGNPLIFTDFQGISSDSYTLTVSGDGGFTGCTSLKSYVLFFKDNYIYKIYGNTPQNYQMISLKCDGISRQNSNTIASYNGIAYYLSHRGVMAFDGNAPYLLSEPLGNNKMAAGSGITDGKIYAITTNENNLSHTYILDLNNGEWAEKSSEDAKLYLLFNEKIHFFNNKGELKLLFGNEAYMEWYAVFGKYFENRYEKKHYKKIFIDYELGKDAEIQISVSYNGNSIKKYYSSFTEGRFSVPVTVNPNRSEYINIHISGKGFCKLFSIGRELIKGSACKC